jgi:hypothetical protein
MRASLHRVMTTITVGLVVVARASAPGATLTLTPPRPGQPARDRPSRPDRSAHP